VAGRQVVQPAEALEAGAQGRPLDPHAADGVGAVEHHEGQAGPGRRLHAEQHGGLVRVEAGPHVLDVEAEDVEPGQGRRRRPERSGGGAVEGVDREPGGGVHLPLHRHHVLRIAADAVLGTEERRQGHAWQGVEQVGGVAQPAVDGGGVADQPDPAAAQRPAPRAEQDLQPDADGRLSEPAGA
jgi:hypothetical protein